MKATVPIMDHFEIKRWMKIHWPRKSHFERWTKTGWQQTDTARSAFFFLNNFWDDILLGDYTSTKQLLLLNIIVNSRYNEMLQQVCSVFTFRFLSARCDTKCVCVVYFVIFWVESIKQAFMNSYKKVEQLQPLCE